MANYVEVSNNWGPLCGTPDHKSPTVFGARLGALIFENSHMPLHKARLQMSVKIVRFISSKSIEVAISGWQYAHKSLGNKHTQTHFIPVRSLISITTKFHTTMNIPMTMTIAVAISLVVTT